LPDVIAGIKRIETKIEFLEERLTKLEGKKSRKS
jgi:ubiquinone biosynthesis protein UbiJ